MNPKDIKVAFFDAKEYDIRSFEETNKNYGFDITFIADKLKEQMERRVAEIKEKYPDPPRREQRQQGRPQQRKGKGHRYYENHRR